MCVYGIWISKDGHDELVYIGSTMRQLKDRFLEHKKCIDDVNCKKQSKLYNGLRYYKMNGWEVTMSVMIDVKELKYHPDKMWTKRDLEMIEFSLISYFKPKLNSAGVSSYFVF